MRIGYLLMFAGCAAGCASPAGSRPPPSHAGNPEVSSNCINKRLASFGDVTIPSTFDVDMVLDGEWRPAPSIRLVLHHATRLELENLADFEKGLPTAAGARAVFTLTFVDERIEPPASGGGYFRSTYVARLTRVCEPAPASGHS